MAAAAAEGADLPCPSPNCPKDNAVTDRLLTTRQVADLLGLSPETILRRYRQSELPGFRLASNCLRFRESEVEAWLEASGCELDDLREDEDAS